LLYLSRIEVLDVSSPWMSIKKLLYSRLLIEGCHYQLKEVRENLKLTMLAIFLEIQKVEE